MAPRLSVCLPVIDKDTLFQRTLDSLDMQTFQDFELVLVREEQPTLLPAMCNKALIQSQGEFIKFLLPGDVLQPVCLQKMMDAVERNENVVLVSSAARYINDDGAITKRSLNPHFPGFHTGTSVLPVLATQLQNRIGSLSQTMFRRDAAFEGFNEKLYGHYDLELWIRILVNGNFFGLSQPLLAIPEFDRFCERARVEESMLLMHDLLELKQSLEEYACRDHQSAAAWSSKVDELIRERFSRLRKEKQLNRELVERAAGLFAESLDERALRSVVRDLAGLAFDRADRLQSDSNDLSLSQLKTEVRMLRKKLRTMGESVWWRYTEPLRVMNAKLRKQEYVANSFGKGRWVDNLCADAEQLLTAEMQDLRQQIRRISESRSWKLTAYLRNASSTVAGGRVTIDAVEPLKADLLVLDDTFPCKLSPFRYSEYSAYLDSFPNSVVLSTGQSITLLDQNRSLRDEIKEFRRRNPQFANRVRAFNPAYPAEAGLAYCVFLWLAHQFLPFFEANKIPFAFTLYPGGTLKLGDSGSDKMLRRVFASEMFRRVITTQRVTTDYLLDGGFCRADQITEIIGAIFPKVFDEVDWETKRLFGKHKETLDLCFVAYKYGPGAREKGYDLFAAAARQLAAKYSNVFFHVVGGFEYADEDVVDIGDRVKFYGTLETERMIEFYRNMDLIVSPARQVPEGNGGFDGFPTGACMEAGLCGVAVVSSDTMRQNLFLKAGSDFILIEPDARDIVEKTEEYLQNPQRLYELAQQGQNTFRKHYGTAAQLQPRIELLCGLMGKTVSGDVLRAKPLELA